MILILEFLQEVGLHCLHDGTKDDSHAQSARDQRLVEYAFNYEIQQYRSDRLLTRNKHNCGPWPRSEPRLRMAPERGCWHWSQQERELADRFTAKIPPSWPS